MKLKLQASIVLAVIIGLLIPVSVTSLFNLSYREQALTQRLRSDHARLTEILALGMKEPLWTFNPEAARPLFDSVLSDPRVVAAEVRDKKLGAFLYQELRERRIGRQFKATRDVVYNDSGVIGTVTVEIDTGQLEAELASDRWMVLAIVSGQLLLSLMLIVALLRARLVTPIRRLMQESDKLARRELTEPFNWLRGDEFGDLGNSIENTRGALQALFGELEAKNRELENLSREQQTILENALVGIAFLKERHVVRCNQAFAAMFGYPVEQLIGASTRLLHVSEEAYLTSGAEFYGAVERGGSYSTDVLHRRKDGSTFWVNSSVSAIDRKDITQGVIWVIQDIDQRKRAEEALQDREARIRRLVESNIIGVYFWDIDGGITDGNDAFLRMVGRDRRELVEGGIRWTEMTPPEFRAVEEHALEELRVSGSCVPYEKEYLRADGTRVPVLIGAALLEDSQRYGVSFVLDLTEQKRAEERIRYLAQHDALTGLPNRILLQDRITQAIVQARRSKHQVGVLFIDLDYFKRINDSLGHQTGDRLLQMVAGRLQRCLREGDSVARLGGDEFVINLPMLTDGNDAGFIAQKVLAAINRDFVLNDNELHVTCSIGISIFPTDGDDAEALMRAADIAMYDAKERGRNQCQFFAPHLNEVAHARLELANRLHHALRRNELLLHYQPQVELASNTVQSVEALLRWRQPNGTLVSCGEFAAIAEETGLILQIGEWTLREACRQLRRWYQQGRSGMRVAVNVSPRQFRQSEFHEIVAQVLKETGVPGEALELEITESVLMLQSPELVTTMERLVALGVCLSVDDFGVGYSSLAYLRRFPIRALKIDRSFIEGIGNDPNDTAIVTAIIAMARGLHLRIVAEGVEREEQLNFLRGHDCDAVQGFYFSEPVSAEKLFDVLEGTRFRRHGA